MGGGRGGGRAPKHYARALRCNTAGPFQICFLRACSVNLIQRLRTATPGNPTYAAPEVENAALQSPKMDIFSFGILLVEMCTARFPDLADREHLILSIQHHGMVGLIRQCLAEDRNTRPAASDIIAELSEQDNT